MGKVELKLDDEGKGFFYIEDTAGIIARMDFEIKDSSLIVEHTKVEKKAEGKGLAKKLFDSMIEYSRKKKLQINALCPFVHSRLEKDYKQYQDVWERDS